MLVASTYNWFGTSANLASTLNATTEISNVDGNTFIAFYITVPSGATIQFELTYDGINWDTCTMRSTQLDRFQYNTTVSGPFEGSIIGARKVRFYTTVAGSGTGTVIGTMTKQTATLESIEFGYPPHRFGFEPIHKDAEYSTQQTASSIWIPATGKKIVVTDISVIIGGSTDGTLSIFNGSGDTTGNRIFRGNVIVSTNRNFVYSQRLGTPFIGVVDGSIKITTSAAMVVDVMLRGYEI